MMRPKSSFIQRKISKEDAIIQLFRPALAGRVTNSLDVFERIVSEAEVLTELGVTIKAGAENHHCTIDDLKANLDEFGELQELAKLGRALLDKLGYVSPRKATPIAGQAPVGAGVEVQPFSAQLPGQEPLAGAVVRPIKPGRTQPPKDPDPGTTQDAR